MARHGMAHDMGNVWKSMNHGWIMDGIPCAMAKKNETGRSDSQNCPKKGYGPIFDHFALLELKLKMV